MMRPLSLIITSVFIWSLIADLARNYSPQVEHSLVSLLTKIEYKKSHQCPNVGSGSEVAYLDNGLVSVLEQNGTTKVSILIYNESLARMERLIETGFKEGFTMTLNNLENLLTTLFKN